MKETLFKLTLAFTVICAFTTCTIAQGVNITIDGESMSAFGRGYNNLKGSPYLYKDWAKGTVKLNNGIVYEGLSLLYDQIKDELIFSTEEGERKLFMQPVHEFVLQRNTNESVIDERIYRNGFIAIDGASVESFYEVLYDGDIKLLKRTSKAIVEERPDGSIVKERLIKESIKYYVATPEKMIKMNTNIRSVLAALQDKNPTEVKQYVKTNRLNLKDDADLVKLIAFYNSL